MKALWKDKPVGEVLRLEYGKPLDGADRKPDGLYPVYGANGEKDRSDKFYFDKPSIIVGRKGSAGEVNLTTERFWPLDVTYFVTFDERQHNLQFLYYLLTTLDLPNLAKGVKPGINRNEVYSKVAKIPPLPEQQRIVGILDEAFDGIATAKANAEKNLQNARTLFESHLRSIFTQRGKGWAVRRISEIAKHSLGKMLDKAKNKGEPQPYLRNINVRWFTFDLSDLLQMPFLPQEAARYTAAKGDVLICEGGYPGRAAIWDGDYPIYFQKALHRVRFHEPEHSKWFVYYLFAQDKSGELKQHFSGTGIQHFTGEVLAQFELPLPPLSELRQAVARFEELSAETKRLESIYQKKLAALEALKKSLLHQAFTGRLTADSIAVSAPAPTRFPTELEGISTTDLHAGILALSHQFHEKAGKLEHFGHVKAEKIAHMIEARLGIELGRKPMKDAAGPNDFPHLHKVEHRARKANFFDFKRVEGAAYRVHKLRSFDRLIERTRAALGGRANVVDGLLELMLPMQTQQAEIFCTVYAAWNNLLLGGKRPTDEEIVFEARENWHPDKLKIPREKFISAIEWIRNKALAPPGKGKKVCSRVE